MASKEPITTRARRVPTSKSSSGFQIYDENAAHAKNLTKKSTSVSTRVALSDISNLSDKETKEQKPKKKETTVSNPAKPTTAFKTTTSFVMLPQAKRAPIVPRPTRQSSAIIKPVSSNSNPFGLNESKEPVQKIPREVGKMKVEDPMEVEESESECEINIEDLDEIQVPASKKQAIDYFREVEEEVDEFVEDIDATDHEDPQFCTEYVSYIMDNLREREVHPRIYHLTLRNEINHLRLTWRIRWKSRIDIELF